MFHHIGLLVTEFPSNAGLPLVQSSDSFTFVGLIIVSAEQKCQRESQAHKITLLRILLGNLWSRSDYLAIVVNCHKEAVCNPHVTCV
jgi:hypothetical protein